MDLSDYKTVLFMSVFFFFTEICNSASFGRFGDFLRVIYTPVIAVGLGAGKGNRIQTG